jgi:hypothetical protein
MKDLNDFWYSITRWDNSVFDTDDVEEARIAVREGREVTKTTRRVFESGPAFIRLFASVEVKKIRDL